MSCGHEHYGCDYGHGDHDHDHDDHAMPGTQGEEVSLWKVVDRDHVVALNAGVSGTSDIPTAGAIIKPWDERFDVSVRLVSDADAQIILQIPFTASVKLKSIVLSGGPGSAAPRRAHLYANREDVDFDTVGDLQPDQTLELIREPGASGTAGNGSVPRDMPEYAVKIAKFTGLKSLTLFIDASFASEEGYDDVTMTGIYYLGLKGEYQSFTANPIITSYEAYANPADHKTKTEPHGFQFSV